MERAGSSPAVVAAMSLSNKDKTLPSFQLNTQSSDKTLAMQEVCSQPAGTDVTPTASAELMPSALGPCPPGLAGFGLHCYPKT